MSGYWNCLQICHVEREKNLICSMKEKKKEKNLMSVHYMSEDLVWANSIPDVRVFASGSSYRQKKKVKHGMRTCSVCHGHVLTVYEWRNP